MSELTIQDWLQKAPEYFDSSRAGGIEAVIQLILSGEQGGEWYFTVKDQQLEITPGKADNSRLTMSASSEDILQILTGKMDAMRAFMQGKLRVTGDMSLAMKLTGLFKGSF